MHRLYTYWTVWYLTASSAFQQTFISPWTNVLFLFGKVVRFAMMLIFLFVIKGSGAELAGYSANEIVLFFLTYQFLDVSTQILLRGVYMFSPLIQEGQLDSFLSKPISPLFRALTGHPDINDTIFLLPVLIVSFWVTSQLDVNITLASFLWYCVLLLNGYVIAVAFHILVLAAGILLTEVDGIIWLYRDLIRLGQFPVSVYSEPLRSILYFIIPVGVMVTVPADVLLGTITPLRVIGAFLVGSGLLGMSYYIWKWSLKQYSGAGG